MIHVSNRSRVSNELSLAKIREVAQITFHTMNLDGDASIIFTSDEEIRQLNVQFREINAVTDVLSFPSEEIDPMTNRRYLGDVIIADRWAADQALNASRSLFDELCMLIVHGCLHLSGLDHYTNEEKKIMQNYQESILKKLGVNNNTWPEDN